MYERWKIGVEGTGISVYGSYDEQMSEEEVIEDWLESVANDFGRGLAETYRSNAYATKVGSHDPKEDEPPVGELEDYREDG
jgi:hypothetical protein